MSAVGSGSALRFFRGYLLLMTACGAGAREDTRCPVIGVQSVTSYEAVFKHLNLSAMV